MQKPIDSSASKPSIVGVIPARYASTRFPGKPLVDILGKTMIQRVVEQVSQCAALSRVIVATDDERIAAHVREFGGEVILTKDNHESGTERIGEVAEKVEADYFINIQGDEPLIDPGQIAQVADLLLAGAGIATLIFPLGDEIRYLDPNAIKVVINEQQQAMYFSRSPIPHARDGQGVPKEAWQHIGIYGFRTAILKEVVRLAPHILEQTEKLEQLRWLAQGYSIACGITQEAGHSVDRPEDLEAIFRILHSRKG
ncbi:MAG: 3-deoxy-manno-octulosonate cytidylyltransferase [Bacteroidia bacterium]|nr:3-deoxy-manno-octulosonate cytidylyltransferase [Bacteroidia bacterium]